jgi:hypothetical protein
VVSSSTIEGLALGFRVKTGRAVVVVVAGSVKAPRVVGRHELVLADEAVQDSFQPYHAGLALAPKQAEATVRRLSEIVRKASMTVVGQLIDELRAAGMDPGAAGVVVGSLVDPSTVKNPHMHAHAAEERLFFESPFIAGSMQPALGRARPREPDECRGDRRDQKRHGDRVGPEQPDHVGEEQGLPHLDHDGGQRQHEQ